jgi:PHD/YefM family antitoxin component YafN of YafNO toxin-antitoxin module
MEAIYKLKANEINPNLMETIKKLFSGKEITITITAEPDETTYLTMNPANKKHLLESIAQEPSVKFTPGEFREMVDKM